MTPTSTLSPINIALARHHTLRLLAGLYMNGVTSVNLPYLRALPALAGGVPPAGPGVAERLAALAADHHELFQFNVFPFASIFLGTEGLAGGVLADQARARYADFGFTPADEHVPDHIGQMLAALAHLNQQAATAHRSGTPAAVAPVSQAQAMLLHEALLPWIAPCLLAVSRHGPPVYVAAADLTLELLATLAEEIPAGVGQPPHLPPTPDILENPDTRLRDIAHWLLTPAYSGIYLARADILRLGRDFNLPRGFGGRAQMLTNLLRAAAQYDQWLTLLATLGRLVTAWEEAYADLVADRPVFAPYVDQWQAQLVMTERLLLGLEAGGEITNH